MRDRARRPWLPIVVALVLVWTLGIAVPVAHADPVPTTMGLLVSDMDPQPVGRHANIRANFEGTQPIGGTVTFYRIDESEAEIEIGSAQIQSPFGPAFATIEFPGDLGVGEYRVTARYDDPTYGLLEAPEELIQHVGPRPTMIEFDLNTPTEWPATTVVQGDPIFVRWQVLDLGNYLVNPLAPSGSVSATLDGNDIDIPPETASKWSTYVEVDTSTLSLGSHEIEVSFGGSGDFQPSSSSPQSIVVEANEIEATGVGVDRGTFYPRKDGYRDRVYAVGDRMEPLAVSVRIYDKKGHKVRTLEKALGSGAYRIGWDGKDSHGDLLPAGSYRVLQTLRDAAGDRLDVSKTVKLSLKRLVTKTALIEKRGSAIKAKGTSGKGKVLVSGALLRLTIPSGKTGTASVGWQFTLPSAVAYKKLSFQVRNDAPMTTGPNGFGMQHFTSCPSTSGDWDLACFSPWTEVGAGHLAWQSVKGSATHNRHGRVVRGAVAINFGTVTVHRVRIKVTYQVLR